MGFDPQKNDLQYTFPGEGEGDVIKIIKDLLENGYEGGFSIEPHMAVVFHDEDTKTEDTFRFNNYVEYGRRVVKLVGEIEAEIRSRE